MAEEFVANYEDIELAKINYANPGTGVSANPELSHLSKQQKVALARGVSPLGSFDRIWIFPGPLDEICTWSSY